jgi:hypothetical protein
MSPGTGWKPFQITAQGYEELVPQLRRLDLEKFRHEHRARFVPDRIVVDETLHGSGTHLDWIKKAHQKYP